MNTNEKSLVPVKNDSILKKIKKILMFIFMDGNYNLTDNSMKAEEYQDEDDRYKVYLKYKDSFEKEEKSSGSGDSSDKEPEENKKKDRLSIEEIEEKYRNGDLSLMDFTYVEINSLHMYYIEKIAELKEINGMRKKKVMERQRKNWE